VANWQPAPGALAILRKPGPNGLGAPLRVVVHVVELRGAFVLVADAPNLATYLVDRDDLEAPTYGV
jgi:hypothetical protein